MKPMILAAALVMTATSLQADRFRMTDEPVPQAVYDQTAGTGTRSVVLPVILLAVVAFVMR